MKAFVCSHCRVVDESVPSQQGLKQVDDDGYIVLPERSMSPFHHNKD